MCRTCVHRDLSSHSVASRIIRTRSSASAPSRAAPCGLHQRVSQDSHRRLLDGAYLAEGEETPQLDEAVEVAEADVNGYEDDIRWITEEMAP